ncbi:alpha/beta fold hydrolase [Deminuibacter soli]|uniref:Alpha/beta hydrolase n=1 Tax=Deminuibacter soli TaxID=2291815 RepID=A0A3E1NPA0_9BACT|nr:alpha/beta hydrolase [Deminuibacter soli]RFM29743.1 alpha/beta hydrolase [Deminuibacter soli]
MKNKKAAISIRSSILAILFSITIASGTIGCAKDDLPTKTTDSTAIDYHQTATTQFVEAGGVKFAYRVLGKQQGTPLVVLSHLGASMDDWDPALTNGLAQHYKVILFDNKGVGSSTGTTPTTIADMANDAVTFIKALGYTKVNLLGYSMGGFITQQILLTQPSLVNKVILSGTGPKGADGLLNLPNVIGAAAGLSAEDQFLKLGFTDSQASIALGKQVYARVNKRTVNRDTPVSEASTGAGLTAVLAWGQPYPNALTELKAVTQPVLIMSGENDMLVPIANAVNLSKAVQNGRVVIFPDANHAALFQYADEFVKNAINFLGE